MADRVVVVMGPSGCGKSTVGLAAARLAGAGFLDADDHHTDEAKARMAAGVPLTDAERAPWVRRLSAAVRDAPEGRVVLACSALSALVREWLCAALPGEPAFVLLDVPDDVLRARLERRPGHFAGPSLLASQRAALDAAGTHRLDGTRSPRALAREVASMLTG